MTGFSCVLDVFLWSSLSLHFVQYSLICPVRMLSEQLGQSAYFCEECGDAFCEDEMKGFYNGVGLCKGCLPEGFCTVRFPLVFHNGTTSNHRAGPILRWDQLQSEAIWFTALPEAALYTTTFSRDFQAMKGRLSCLWLAGTNIRESLRVDNNTWRQCIKCK